MGSRITEKDLESICQQLNKVTDSPIDTYGEIGKANIGNYHISYAYGGVSLHRVTSEGGSIDDVFRCGYITKRDLFSRISAFIDGYDLSMKEG